MINRATLIGRLGKDPEFRSTNSGNVCNFSIATTEKYKDKTSGETKEITDWHNLVLWGNLADIAAKYLHKGDLIYVEGKIRTRSWEKDGVTRYTTEVICNNMTMLNTKRDSQQQPAMPPPAAQPGPADMFAGSPGTKPAAPPATDATDDLPF